MASIAYSCYTSHILQFTIIINRYAPYGAILVKLRVRCYVFLKITATLVNLKLNFLRLSPRLSSKTESFAVTL
jgi:hypothetical protein